MCTESLILTEWVTYGHVHIISELKKQKQKTNHPGVDTDVIYYPFATNIETDAFNKSRMTTRRTH